MKKILLFASAFALLTGCSKLEHAPESPINQKVDGIVFQANLDIDTKGELYQDEVTKNWNFKWFAEADKMEVYYANIADPAEPAPDWDAVAKATYKATRTLGEGYFAATGTPISFTTDNNLSFRFVYPSSTTVAEVSDKLVATLPPIVDLAHTAVIENIFMVGKLDNVAPVYENNPAVADNLVGMQLRRQFPIAYFKLKNYDKELYGNLTSIKLTSLGTLKTAATETAPAVYNDDASILDYGDKSTYNLETGEYTQNASNALKTLTVTVGEAWEDGAPVFMLMNRVDRSKNTKAEWVKIEYVFAEATFTVEKPLGLNTSFEAHKLYEMSPAGGFDLATADYVVLGAGNPGATLLLNKSFNQSIESLVTGGKVTAAEISKVVANVALSDADFAYVGKEFTTLAEVTLNENTAIPAFKTGQTVQTITKLVAPKVTVINEKAFEGMTMNLTHCILPSYDFKNAAITASLLKSANLTHLDISSVDRIGIDFAAGGVTLQDFAKLAEVTVKPGVTVEEKAFSGCSVLPEVKFPAGTVGASINLAGEYAFEKAVKLTKISISNTEIPAGAFAGCTELATVTLAGKAIVPTTIGAEAFKGTKLVDIDLSQATEIGASAFEGCTALKGTKNASGLFVLNVDAITKLNDNTFKGCKAIKYIGFKNVETVGNDFLAANGGDAVECIEISFGKKITATKTFANTSFGTTSNTTLYVAKDQTGVNNNILSLATTNATTFVATTFKAINKR